MEDVCLRNRRVDIQSTTTITKMKKLALTLSLLVSLASYCQDIQFLELRYSNKLGENTVVHTIYLDFSLPIAEKDTDPVQKTDAKVEEIVRSFSAISGVSQATYDRSTQTITVVANPGTDIGKTVSSLNQNHASHE